jgi:hydrogenase maturation protease
MLKTLVLGLGNPLRADDGAGPAAVEALARLDLPLDVDLLDGGAPGLETVLLLQGYERAIVVDAADMGLEPGAWRRLAPETIRIAGGDAEKSGTLHAAGLAEALELGRALGVLPETIIIYGIQPQNVGWSEGLTEPLQAAMPYLCAEIRGVLGEPGLEAKRQAGRAPGNVA